MVYSINIDTRGPREKELLTHNNLNSTFEHFFLHFKRVISFQNYFLQFVEKCVTISGLSYAKPHFAGCTKETSIV